MTKNTIEFMKEEILSNLDNPAQLEKLYRTDKNSFRRAFNLVYPGIKERELAAVWHERLNYYREEFSFTNNKELGFVVLVAFIAGLIAKLPALLPIDENFFYPRNLGFILFPALTAYFAWKNRLPATRLLMVGAGFLAAAVFINLHPGGEENDTLILSCIHLLFFLWSLSGFAFAGGIHHRNGRWLGYLKYNGDLVVMTTLIVIAAGILTGITIGLFALIGLRIEEFYFENIVVFGLPAAPVVGSYLIQNNPQLVGKVSPVIARIFSPLVLLMLVIYLLAIVYSGKDPYNDREFLIMFNALLIGVMAIIFFSVAETSATEKSRIENWILFLLSLVTIIVNGVALSAILFRISEWGITPNRAAVLGGNVLILANLLLVAAQLFRVLFKKAPIGVVGQTIGAYIPVYIIWAVIVTFLFPFLFGFS